MRSRQNTFIAFLELLRVKHTNDFSNKFFNEHPHRYNLFGLSKILSDNYKIGDLKYFTETKYDFIKNHASSA